MGDLIQTSDILGAELLCGYQYFDAKNMLNEQKRIAQEELSNLQNKKTQARNSFDKSADLTQVAGVQFLYKAYQDEYKGKKYEYFRNSRLSELSSEIADVRKDFVRFLVYFLLLAVMTVTLILGLVLTNFAGGNNGETDKYVPMMPLSIIGMMAVQMVAYGKGYFWLFGGLYEDETARGAGYVYVLFAGMVVFPISLLVYLIKAIVKLAILFKLKKEKSKADFRLEYERRNPMLTIRQFVNNMDNMLKDEYYKKLDQENINKKVALIEQQIQEQRLAVQFVENQIVALENEGLQIVKDLTEIPAYYFQEESILQMLFFYVNKRADNIKELINLYEQTVFQEELLGSLNSISVSIDRLANAIDNNFRRLGLQLGVINESINANTQQLVLNKSKLAQIQDESSRNYIQTVEHINNVEKIITDQLNSGLTVTVKS